MDNFGDKNYTIKFWTILDNMKKIWIKKKCFESCGYILDHFGPFWTDFDHYGQFKTISNHFRPVWAISGHLGEFMTILEFLFTILDLFEPICT